MLPDPPKRNSIIVQTATVNSQEAGLFVARSQKLKTKPSKASSTDFLILSNTDLELHGKCTRSKPVTELLNHR